MPHWNHNPASNSNPKGVPYLSLTLIRLGLAFELRLEVLPVCDIDCDSSGGLLEDLL